MSTLDFVQIRWQQIRLTESAQLIESENIALKKELKELREKAAATPVVVADPNAGAAQSIVKKSCANMTNILMRLQSELVKLKLTSVQEIAGLVNQKSLLEKAFDKFGLKYRNIFFKLSKSSISSKVNLIFDKSSLYTILYFLFPL